jgi:hypothetical protein
MRAPLIGEALALLARATTSAERAFATGRLVALGAEEHIPEDEDRPSSLDLGIGEVDEDAFAIVELLERLDDRSPNEIFLEVRERLRERDRIELCLLGAERSGGFQLGLDDEASLAAFDQTLRPHLWRLTALNTWRSVEASWIAPHHRDRFWWWTEAADVDPRGAVALGAVASLMARFPEVARRLEQIAATSLLIDWEATAEVIDFRGWLEAKLGGALRMAAATAREHVLFEHSSFTVSFLSPGSIFVDLLEARGAALPAIRIDRNVFEGSPVAGAVDRYHFPLAPVASASRLELVVSLESGTVAITLP